MKILSGVIITLIALIALLLVVVYSRWYDVSANEPESGIMKWALNTMRDKSIQSRIDEISIPELNDTGMIKEGYEHYNEMCVSCHGAPGLEETELSVGLNPPAPHLVKITNNVDPKELFWVTKNGIRMTGMPAWGKTHSDEKIWAIVAFIKMLPKLSAEEYQALSNEDGSEFIGS